METETVFGELFGDLDKDSWSSGSEEHYEAFHAGVEQAQDETVGVAANNLRGAAKRAQAIFEKPKDLEESRDRADLRGAGQSSVEQQVREIRTEGFQPLGKAVSRLNTILAHREASDQEEISETFRDQIIQGSVTLGRAMATLARCVDGLEPPGYEALIRGDREETDADMLARTYYSKGVENSYG